MHGLSIRTKLMLLAGVPVLGALILASLIARGARQQAAAAAALGSIEDVAQLSVRIGAALHSLQLERARVAASEGSAAKAEVAPSVVEEAEAPLALQYAATDDALVRLERFLSDRDLSKLPPRLARDLGSARKQVAMRGAFRTRVKTAAVPLDEILGFYDVSNDSLIRATAALTQLSDDGELLRRISSLVALSELTERGSREHALLSYVFASTEFPPGSFKTLVTLFTEQAVYANQFQAYAADAQAKQYEVSQKTPESIAAIEMRDQALATTDDVVTFDVAEWFREESNRLGQLQKIEDTIVQRLSAAATLKVATIRASIRTSVGLSAMVVAVSALLAWTIARGLTRTVFSLSGAASTVRKTKDYGVRVQKTSRDELGMLTDAFNEMLSDIQVRDRELQNHRQNLEQLVAARTAELVERNAAMRLVLDNVEQGLATVRTDGTIDTERSAAFDQLFGTPSADVTFARHLSGQDDGTAAALALGWGQVVEDILPLELTVEQMPKRIDRDGKHVTLAFKPILKDEKLRGALLIATDVTAEFEARQEQERQREYVAVFERVMRDRDGFVEFATETNRLIERLARGTNGDETMRLVHTVKGNAAQWGVSSVARIAHELESALISGEDVQGDDRFDALFAAWDVVSRRFAPLIGDDGMRVVVTRDEMDTVLNEIRAKLPHDELHKRLERLKHEATSVRFERMSGDIERLAERVGKPKPRIVVDAQGVRLPASRFASFWQATVHVLRNIMDHGIEPPEERAVAGKPTAGTVILRATTGNDQFRLEIADDGRGVDWATVKAKAEAAGLPTSTAADLEKALFASGVSTAESITDLSGRGVGLSSVEERCLALGGTVSVESDQGKGTRFVFTFPKRGNEHSIAPPKRTAGLRAAGSA